MRQRFSLIKNFQIIFLSAILVFSILSFGAEVPLSEAQKVAERFIFHQMNNHDGWVHNSNIRHFRTLQDGNNAELYIFNIGQEGFVIISGEDEVYPVLGWSTSGAYGSAEEPPALTEWLKSYQNQINFIREHALKGDENIRQAWNLYLSDSPKSSFDNGKTNIVNPLLTTNWDQGAYYNAYCPADSLGPGKRVYAGCVATAMAQVMYYYRYPETGTGSSSYYHFEYGTQSANHASATFRWNEMTEEATGKNYEAIAMLLYHLGVSVEMNYSPNGSGAQSYDAADALVDHFGYDPSLTLVYRGSYSSNNWANLLKSNLDSGHPMYYHGFGSGGHAFNVDGYQTNDHFHFNWGWSGAYNGYFYLTNLNPGSSNFTNGQGAIINFKPPTNTYPGYCSGVSQAVTSMMGSLEDGSGPLEPYQNMTNCSWLIQPTGAISHIELKFKQFSLENGNDYLKIYDGINENAPLIATLTGDSIYTSIVTTGGAAFLKFTSDAQTTSSGWYLEYEAFNPNFCTNMQIFTDPQGTFDDGSGNYNYNNNTNCKFLINPSGSNNIHLTFTHFVLEPNRDFLKIYDPTTTPSTLLANLTGTSTPPPINTTSGQLMLIFITDHSNTKSGWEVSYTTAIGVQEPMASSDIEIYPNPANDWVTINFPDHQQPLQISFYDLSGRNLLTIDDLNDHETKTTIPLDKLRNGIYLLKITGDHFLVTKKLTVKR